MVATVAGNADLVALEIDDAQLALVTATDEAHGGLDPNCGVRRCAASARAAACAACVLVMSSLTSVVR